MGSNLVTVHNQEENVYIQHRHNGEKSWIGLNDRSVEGSFVWTKKGTSNFRYWAPNQPNNYTDQDCVHTLGAKNGYTWNDVSCDNCFKFTCFKGKRLTRFKRRERLYLEPCHFRKTSADDLIIAILFIFVCNHTQWYVSPHRSLGFHFPLKRYEP